MRAAPIPGAMLDPTSFGRDAVGLGSTLTEGLDVRHGTILTLEDINVSFDGFKALTNLTLYIGVGELRCIIGPNGAGKTTMMDVITGKTRPDSGVAYFGEQYDLTRLSEVQIAQAGIGRKFQKPTVFEALSVFENLELAQKTDKSVWASLRARLSGEQRDRIEEVLTTIRLEGSRQRPAGLLSHGQKQFLEIGMLLVQEPHLLLLDEPVAGMTDAETEFTAELFKSLARQHSLMVVEHDMGFVGSIADHVTVLHQGSVLAEGSLEQVQNDERVIEVYLGREPSPPAPLPQAGEGRQAVRCFISAPCPSPLPFMGEGQGEGSFIGCAVRTKTKVKDITMLQVQQLHQYYGGSHILRGLSFEVRVGEVTCLLGRNGVGKTTLLKCLMGLLAAKEGQVQWEGHSITAYKPHQRVQAGIAYVPQGREIFGRLTVEENLLMGLSRFPASQAREVPAFIYELFPVLREMKQRRGGDLSGGQQQQLAIGRALASQPRLLILDEPTEGIQPSVIKEIGVVIRKLAERGDMAILLVEQFYDFAAELADQYLVMSRGEIIQQGRGETMEAEGVRGLVTI